MMSQAGGPESAMVVQRLLDMLKSGDGDASRRLLDVSMDRLRTLSRKILADIPGVKRWEETDDLLQNASVRLWKALERSHPPTTLDYYRLAAAVIRRELIDLSRHYFGPQGIAANQAKTWVREGESQIPAAEAAPDQTYDPQQLGRWTEFHEYVDKLPEEDRTLFDLLWYQGMTLGEAAETMGAAERTVRRRWKTARVNLYRALLDESDGASDA